MKVLVIPDCHLKPFMFDEASSILENGLADCAVCLMDIPDDFGLTNNLEAYDQTFDAAISFAKRFPETRWCYGNHDLCYVWDERESGYSLAAAPLVRKKLGELQDAIPDENLKYVHRIDNVLFCHGGISQYFVEEYVDADRDDIDAVLEELNSLGHEEMWNDASPIWYRPQDSDVNVFGADRYLQVVGHTPVENVELFCGVLSCDNFSTYRDGRPIGTMEFVIVDTESWEYELVK